MTKAILRAIPAVEKVLQALGQTDLPRPVVVATVRRELAALRSGRAIPDFDAVAARIRDSLRTLSRGRIQPLLNGTGIIIHTNLGRAPLGPAVIETLREIGSSYNNLEYDLVEGKRGHRAAYLEHNLALLCESEAATVVNNNAAALVLILRQFCAPPKCEVIISRGELVQIGGEFRVPEILEVSGARLREIGTTNKTSLRDYERAVRRETALILKVHRSNFFMEGFVESPSTGEISQLARKKRVLFVEDLGSGAILNTEEMLPPDHEPTPTEVLRQGVDLICFSGDKLLGGPQAGVIAGKGKLVAALKKDPFFRALRCDKLILSALQTTVDLYLKGANAMGDSHMDLPVVTMLRLSNEELKRRGEKLVQQLSGLPLKAGVGTGKGQIGGGTLPRAVIPSVTLDVAPQRMALLELSRRLREGNPPLIGYTSGNQFKIDLRTIFPHQDQQLVGALRQALG